MILRRKNARRVWEPEEDKQLREMVEAGKSPTMIALRFKQTEMAVRQRLYLLKVHLRDVKKTDQT
jgi:hypothetical protein